MSYTTIHVEASRSYDILIGRGLLDSIGEMLRPIVGDCRLGVRNMVKVTLLSLMG